ncbi:MULTISPECIES: GerAB/ArcD/ProY family transporter [unclassified Ruminococcus]|uniref:GerAB/ArcD/ProY family transporter n=1 Tax=unclassified Ruminococcus TaxID=2608920 RepID=UPI00210D6BFF
MGIRNKISASQLFCLLLLSRGVLSVACGAFSGSGDIGSAALSAVIALIISILLSIPVLYLSKSGTEPLQNGAGRVISGIYALYFFYSVCITMTMFTVLRAETTGLRISIIAVPLIMTAAALYGSYKGIEAIARCGALILFAVVAAFVLLCLSLLSKSDILNLPPVGSYKLSDIITNTVIMVGEQSCIPAIIFIYTHVKGNVKKSVVLWLIVLFVCIFALSLFISSVLGDYALTQFFPVYSWARLSSFGVLQRLDSLFLAVWTAGVFVRLALLFWVISVCVRYAISNTVSKLAPPVFGIFALIIAVAAPFNSAIREAMLNTGVLLFATAFCCLILPAVLIIKRRLGK